MSEYSLTKSVIYGCPAIKVPQSDFERLGMVSQLVVLKGASDEVAEFIVRACNEKLAAAEAARGEVMTTPHKPTCASLNTMLLCNPPRPAACDCGEAQAEAVEPNVDLMREAIRAAEYFAEQALAAQAEAVEPAPDLRDVIIDVIDMIDNQRMDDADLVRFIKSELVKRGGRKVDA